MHARAPLHSERVIRRIRRASLAPDTDTAAEDAGTSGGDEMHVPGQGLVARSAVTAEDRQVAALMADEHPAQVYGVPHDLPGVVGERLIAGFRGGAPVQLRWRLSRTVAAVSRRAGRCRMLLFNTTSCCALFPT